MTKAEYPIIEPSPNAWSFKAALPTAPVIILIEKNFNIMELKTEDGILSFNKFQPYYLNLKSNQIFCDVFPSLASSLP